MATFRAYAEIPFHHGLILFHRLLSEFIQHKKERFALSLSLSLSLSLAVMKLWLYLTPLERYPILASEYGPTFQESFNR